MEHEQPELWDQATPPAVRSTDPVTSRMAAFRGGRGSLKARVLHQLRHRGPLTDDELAVFLADAHPGSVSKRRHDLTVAGFVEQYVDDGVQVTRRTRYGQQALVWCITHDGRIAHNHIYGEQY